MVDTPLLAGQVILVTGSSRGLGAAMARCFGSLGASVVVNYFRSEEKAAEVVRSIQAAGGQAVAIGADVRDREQVQHMVAQARAEFGPLSGVVNNALPDYRFDSAARKDISALDWADLDAQLQGAVRSALNVVQAALPDLEERQGSVLNILSNLVTNPVVPYHDYTAGKAALLGLTRTLAAELGPRRIRVNALAPGLLLATDASAATTPEVFGLIASSTPLRKVTTPEQAARAAVPFFSPLFAAVTGQYLAVDGGLTMP